MDFIRYMAGFRKKTLIIYFDNQRFYEESVRCL